MEGYTMKYLQSLSGSEKEIMEVIWGLEGPVTTALLLDRFSHKGWKIQTLSTFLTRLVEKGVLRMEKRGKSNVYAPALSPAEYRRREARQVVEELYHGSLPDFLTAFYGGQSVSPEELAELRRWFEREAGHA